MHIVKVTEDINAYINKLENIMKNIHDDEEYCLMARNSDELKKMGNNIFGYLNNNRHNAIKLFISFVKKVIEDCDVREYEAIHKLVLQENDDDDTITFPDMSSLHSDDIPDIPDVPVFATKMIVVDEKEDIMMIKKDIELINEYKKKMCYF